MADYTVRSHELKVPQRMLRHIAPIFMNDLCNEEIIFIFKNVLKGVLNEELLSAYSSVVNKIV